MTESNLVFIIPAKQDSTRVPRKNWREFCDGKCLVDITLQKIRKAGAGAGDGAGAGKIYLTSELCSESLDWCEKNRVTLLPRSPDLSDNSVPIQQWMRSICVQIPGDSEIAWCQVCDPFFDEHEKCLSKWREIRNLQQGRQFDSLVVANRWRGYLMTSGGCPVGWSFGSHHTPSQLLPQWLTMPFTFSVLTRAAIEQTGYHVGSKPFWFVNDGFSVDIDTMDDFEFAAWKYARV